MRVIYARQPLPPLYGSTICPNSIFLAGPTPRPPPPGKKPTPSWRPNALNILWRLNFKGTVLVPEDEGWGLNPMIYEEQTRWEFAALGMAECKVFWVPRNMADMPALTTNVEFGFCVALSPGRTLLGAPPDAVKMGYLRQLAADINLLHTAFQSGQQGKTSPIRCFTSLHDILEAATNFI